MKKMRFLAKLFVTVTAGIFLVVQAGFAQGTGTADTEQNAGQSAPQAQVMKLNLAQCIDLGLKNSLTIKLIEDDLNMARLQDEKAGYFSRKLNSGKNDIDAGQQSLDTARENLEKINQALQQNPNDPTLLAQKKALEEGIASGEADLERGEALLDQSMEQILSGLNNVKDATDLMKTKAGVALDVTQTGRKLADRQIALLIQKQYDDVLKAERVLKVKHDARERAEGQLKLAQDGYDTGMTAKDDVLLAQAQVDLMRADEEKAKQELEAAKMELKKTLNIPLDTEFELEDIFTTEKVAPDLAEGIKQGLEKRLEIRKAKGEYVVYKLNFDVTKGIYPDNTFQYREAELQAQKAWDNYLQAQIDVEADIRNAYQSLQHVQAMLDYIQNSVKNAQENLEIATYKYKVGYPYPSATLKSINADEAAGTILEVLAAQEKLAEIEEKVVEIIYNFNLAKSNYENAIGTGL